MPTVHASITVPGRAAAAEEVWYDPDLWASWIHGFGHLVRLTDGWPQVGARRIYDSPPRGRGRVQETVTAYEVRSGMETAWEDERLEGTQTVAFEPLPDSVKITLTTSYALKHRDRRSSLQELALRRGFSEAARSTLNRFAAELASARQFGR
jgi:hypothetical protein